MVFKFWLVLVILCLSIVFIILCFFWERIVILLGFEGGLFELVVLVVFVFVDLILIVCYLD